MILIWPRRLLRSLKNIKNNIKINILKITNLEIILKNE